MGQALGDDVEIAVYDATRVLQGTVLLRVDKVDPRGRKGLGGGSLSCGLRRPPTMVVGPRSMPERQLAIRGPLLLLCPAPV